MYVVSNEDKDKWPNLGAWQKGPKMSGQVIQVRMRRVVLRLFGRGSQPGMLNVQSRTQLFSGFPFDHFVNLVRFPKNPVS